MLVHSREPDPPEGPGERRPWEPNWLVWRWVAAAAVIGYAASRTEGAVQTLLVFVVFALCCRAIAEAIPYREGLREWRQ